MLRPMSDGKPPASADDWREVWQQDRHQDETLRQRVSNRVFSSAAEQRNRQRDFNLAVLDLLRDVREEINAARADARAAVDALQSDVQAGDEALAADIAKVRELLPVAVRRNDALLAALDQKIETVAVRIRDLTNPAVKSEPRQQPTGDFLYRRLEDGLRGSEREVREAMRPYLEYAKTHQPVVDVGCGRGEFLSMCAEASIAARGFDTNERSVADLKGRGFDVAVAGIPECFTTAADGSLGAILATHVVEHLPAEVLFALYRQAARALRSGGLLMIETPNAESLLVTGSDFWRDPTHLAPRHPAALVLLGREHGFDVEELRAVHPFPAAAKLAASDDDPPALRRVVDAINDRFLGPQDLRLVLRKQ